MIREQLDNHLMPTNAPITSGTPPTTSVPWEWGIKQKLQGKQFKMSRVNIKNFIQNSGITSGTFSLNNNAGVNLTTTIVMNVPHQADAVLSTPYVGVYLGTAQVAGSQIYPANKFNPGSFTCWGGFDFQPFDGTNANVTIQIGNTSGAAGTFFYAIQHKFITYNSGTI